MGLFDWFLGRKTGQGQRVRPGELVSVTPKIEAVLKQRICAPYDRNFAEDFAFDRYPPSTDGVYGEWTSDLCYWVRTMRAALIIWDMAHSQDWKDDRPHDPFDAFYEFSISPVCRLLTDYRGLVHLLPARKSTVALYISGPISALQEIRSRIGEINHPDATLADKDGRPILRIWWPD